MFWGDKNRLTTVVKEPSRNTSKHLFNLTITYVKPAAENFSIYTTPVDETYHINK